MYLSSVVSMSKRFFWIFFLSHLSFPYPSRSLKIHPCPSRFLASTYLLLSSSLSFSYTPRSLEDPYLLVMLSLQRSICYQVLFQSLHVTHVAAANHRRFPVIIYFWSSDLSFSYPSHSLRIPIVALSRSLVTSMPLPPGLMPDPKAENATHYPFAAHSIA
jgi:hypothetical protein